MAQVKHTPGPWRAFICDDGGQWTGWPLSVVAENEEDKTVVRTGGQWPYEWDNATSQAEAVANAHLIAAAPDMLWALNAVPAETDYGSAEAYRAAILAWFEEYALPAIAKAEGQP